MIRDTITLAEFRKDQTALGALRGFLKSSEGQLFAKALRGRHPLTALTDTQEQGKEIRDASIVEGSAPGIASSLLGKIEGFEMCLKAIDDLTKDTPLPPTPVDRQTTRVTKVLQRPTH